MRMLLEPTHPRRLGTGRRQAAGARQKQDQRVLLENRVREPKATGSGHSQTCSRMWPDPGCHPNETKDNGSLGEPHD